MKLRTGILALLVMLGTAWGQNPDVIQNTRDTLQNVQKKQAIDQNAAFAAAGQAMKPATPSQGVAKPTMNSSAAGPLQSKPASAPAAKTAMNNRANTPEAAKTAAPKRAAKTVVAVNQTSEPKQSVAVEDKKVPEESKKKEPREYSAAGRRDPFISPVVSHMGGESGCSSGKRCLAVDQIILTGIVKSEAGMIAVVVNSLNKAYFLRENDPVFNGYVVKITGDSIIFNQTIQDKLGKPFTREVTKRIATPAV